MADPYTPFGRLPPAAPFIPDLSGGYSGPPISYTDPRRQPYGGQLGASAGPAPTFTDRVLGFGNQASGFIDEMTGIPSAVRAGTAAAEGNIPQAVGQGLMALPSRAAAIPGMLMSSAEAQTPDVRPARINSLNKEIARREKILEGYATKNFQSKAAREAASKPHLDAIGTARAEAVRLQEAMDAETAEAAQQQLAAERGAARARTPFQQRYPGALESGVGAMAGVGGAIPFFATRGRIRHFTGQVQALDNQIADAVARANNTTLRQGQTNAALARERTQAANDARSLLAQRDQLVQQGSGVEHGVRGHLGAAGVGGAMTEIPMAGALAHDYLAGRADPSGELYNKTIESVNILDHPGEVIGRYAIPFGLGAALGGGGHAAGAAFGGNVPAGHAGAVGALQQQYRAPRRR